MFKDRLDASEQLADELKKYKDHKNAIVIGIPRGGIVPGFVIAQRLHLPLDMAMVKKLGHPTNPEYAVGAVSLKGYVTDKNSNLKEDWVEREVRRIQGLLKERYKMYYGDKEHENLTGKIVIIVDDGVATGKTLKATIDLVKKENPEKIVVAVPVGPDETIAELEKKVDEVVCLKTETPFYAIGRFYREFGQVSDKEVMEYLEKLTVHAEDK